MSIPLRITLDDRQVQKALQDVARTMPSAAARAINKVLPQVRTEASREIRKLRKLNKSIVDRVIAVQRASASASTGSVTGSVVVTGAPISLKHYGARQLYGRRRRLFRGARGTVASLKGVQVQVTPGKRELLRHAFIGPNGHVYQRASPRVGRLPISRVIGPSLPTAFLNAQLRASLARKAVAKLPPILVHEVQRELAKVGLA